MHKAKKLDILTKHMEKIQQDMNDIVFYYKSDSANFSNWFPKIKDCGLCVPRSFIFETPNEIAQSYFMDNPNKNSTTVFNYVKDVIIPGLPSNLFFLFIKNGTFSNKYDFSTCFVRKTPLDIARALIEQNYSAELVGAGGLSEIIIREFIGSLNYIHGNIPCIYNGMPLRPEFRVFYDFDLKTVLYSVNYWDWSYCYSYISRNITDKIVYETTYPKIQSFYNENKNYVCNLVYDAMKEVQMTGKWSVDLLWDEETCKFYLIDMAPAETSAYWEEPK